MSKKTKAEKHQQRVAKRPRRKAHRRGHLNPDFDLASLSASPDDFLVVRGFCRILQGFQDLGLLDFDKLSAPPGAAAALQSLVMPQASTDGAQGEPKEAVSDASLSS